MNILPVAVEMPPLAEALLPNDLRETALRRRIPAELLHLEDVLAPHTDELSLDLKSWLQQFRDAFNQTAEVSSICDIFIDCMQEILRDPIDHAPLNALAVRGNDERTYNPSTLENFRHLLPPQLTTSPHPIVPEMIRWLQSHGVAFAPVEPVILPEPEPMDPLERLRRRVEGDRKQAMQAEAEVLQHFQELEEALREHVRVQFAPLHQRREEAFDRLDQGARELGGADQLALQRLEEQIEQLQKNITEFRQRNEELANRLEFERDRLDALAQATIRVNMCINEVRQKIQERNKSQSKSLLKTGLLMIGSMVITAGIGAMLSSTPVGGAVIPMNRGIGARVFIPL